MDLITSLTSQAVNKAMDGLSMRHKAIASNLANVDTPHYKRRDVSFEGALKQALDTRSHTGTAVNSYATSNDTPLAMQATRPEHFGFTGAGPGIDGIQPEVTESEDLHFRNDGNAVDVETEMAQLAKNTQRFAGLANMEGRRMKSMRSIITGSGA